jgi:hypothetical protein
VSAPRIGLRVVDPLRENERPDMSNPQHGGHHMEPPKKQMVELADVHRNVRRILKNWVP